MLVLGIESSCDETGLALYDSEQGLLAHALYSQMEMHAEYGGVVPELASRDHIRRVLPLTRQVLMHAQKNMNEINAIAFTQGPGLSGALLVGSGVASGLALALNIPAIGIHHLEGHLLSPLLATPAPTFPFVALLVSGGHSQLMEVAGVGDYQLLGDTLDDAAGEAFDKTAKLLDLGYPGGPALSKLALQGTPGKFKLPRPMLHSGDLNFSFSGLKTAVLNLVNQNKNATGEIDAQARADICLAFQEAIVEVLVAKSLKALEQTSHKQLVVAGGVGANKQLREGLTSRAEKIGCKVFYPPLELCTDNGAMIAFAGALRLQKMGLEGQQSDGGFSVKPRWDLADLT